MRRAEGSPITAVSLALVLVAACGGKADGTLRVTVYGEEFIENGIPADVFSDGWAVHFDKFLVSIGDVTVAVGHGDPAIDDATVRVFDLTRASGGSGHQVVSRAVPGGTYDHAGFAIRPAPPDAVAGNAAPTDVELMVQTRFSLYVAGTATRAAESVSFAWGFDNTTRYAECALAAGDVDGNTAQAVLTIHADHLFYDDLYDATPNVAFDLVAAADADHDGDVTELELAMLDITTQERYQVGSTGVDNLWEFILYQTSTVGHIDGEGHCEVAARE